MKNIFFFTFLFSSLLFSIEADFNFKINNDEFLYKKRIMEKELFDKNFDYIVSFKTYLMYNEYTSSNLFIHFKYHANNQTTQKVQQFLLLQDMAGTPLLYEVQPDEILDLDSIISGTVNGETDLINQYNLPPDITYDTAEKFLKYSYTHTLKFIFRNSPETLKLKVNSNSFFMSLKDGVPIIKTSDLVNSTTNINETQKNTMFFSFTDGFSSSKRTNFKYSTLANIGSSNDFFNGNKLVHDKSNKITTSPSFLGLINSDNPLELSFSSYSLNDSLDVVKQTESVTIDEFYIIKSEIELVE